MFERPEARSTPNTIVRRSPGNIQVSTGSTGLSGSTAPIYGLPHNFKHTSDFDFAAEPWFALISGLASVLGLLVALYPVPASNMPPSDYKTLLWRKSLYISLGFGVVVFSTIQLYQQSAPPVGLLGIFYNILHGIALTNTADYSGTRIWGILLVIGSIISIYGASNKARVQIRKLIIDELAEIRRSEGDAIKRLMQGRDFSELTDEEKMDIHEMRELYKLLRYSTIEMHTGSQFMRSTK
jgi:hypothetical protein